MTNEEKWRTEAKKAIGKNAEYQTRGCFESSYKGFIEGYLAGRQEEEEKYHQCIEKNCLVQTKVERLLDFFDEIARLVENEKDLEEDENERND